MNDKVLILGGCRSGKSRFALEKANSYQGYQKIFLATSSAYDEEMALRITRHQAERGTDWETIECPVDLPQRLESLDLVHSLLLVDCLTMWVNNLIMEDMLEDNIIYKFKLLKNVIQHIQCPIILISNEVGMGIVPENKLVREYRDYLGLLNQNISSCVGHVLFMVAGIPMTVK